jgi:hypothetical protein
MKAFACGDPLLHHNPQKHHKTQRRPVGDTHMSDTKMVEPVKQKTGQQNGSRNVFAAK